MDFVKTIESMVSLSRENDGARISSTIGNFTRRELEGYEVIITVQPVGFQE